MKKLKLSLLFSFFLVLLVSSQVFAQRKTLIKQNGVSIQYEEEFAIKTCDMEEGYKEQIYAHRLTVFLVNENDKFVYFSGVPSSSLYDATFASGRVKGHCFGIGVRTGSSWNYNKMSPKSELMIARKEVLTYSSKDAGKPGFWLPTFTLKDK